MSAHRFDSEILYKLVDDGTVPKEIEEAGRFRMITVEMADFTPEALDESGILNYGRHDIKAAKSIRSKITTDQKAKAAFMKKLLS